MGLSSKFEFLGQSTHPLSKLLEGSLRAIPLSDPNAIINI
jgi:hypothetical protein